MNTLKNYLIAILSGLLVLSITIQPAQSAGKSKDAKIVEYAYCLDFMDPQGLDEIESGIKTCSKYRP